MTTSDTDTDAAEAELRRIRQQGACAEAELRRIRQQRTCVGLTLEQCIEKREQTMKNWQYCHSAWRTIEPDCCVTLEECVAKRQASLEQITETFEPTHAAQPRPQPSVPCAAWTLSFWSGPVKLKTLSTSTSQAGVVCRRVIRGSIDAPHPWPGDTSPGLKPSIFCTACWRFRGVPRSRALDFTGRVCGTHFFGTI